jgi:hypothetical protein
MNGCEIPFAVHVLASFGLFVSGILMGLGVIYIIEKVWK